MFLSTTPNMEAKSVNKERLWKCTISAPVIFEYLIRHQKIQLCINVLIFGRLAELANLELSLLIKKIKSLELSNKTLCLVQHSENTYTEKF